MRVPVTTLTTGLLLSAALLTAPLLSGCATRPQTAHEGALSILARQTVTTEAGATAPAGADAALAKAVQDRVLTRVLATGAVAPGASGARYRLQVAVATAPGEVGVSTGAGAEVATAPWRGAPVKRHFWNRRGPVRTATLSVLDLTSGKVVAWSSVRASTTNADDLADRLVAALNEAKA